MQRLSGKHANPPDVAIMLAHCIMCMATLPSDSRYSE